MQKAKRLWVPVLAAGLIALAIGPGGSAVTAAEPRVTTASIMISAADFIPTTDDWDYSNNGYWVNVGSGNANFSKGLDFPVGVVTIKRITLYALDDAPGAEVCISLYRARPVDADEDPAASLCSTDASAPQAPYTTAIDPRRVARASQQAYLWVHLSGPGVKFYAVKVTYSY
jgi:hypothetical protein